MVASTYQDGFRSQTSFQRKAKRPEHDMSTVLPLSKGLNKVILEQVSSQAGTALAEKLGKAREMSWQKAGRGLPRCLTSASFLQNVSAWSTRPN